MIDHWRFAACTMFGNTYVRLLLHLLLLLCCCCHSTKADGQVKQGSVFVDKAGGVKYVAGSMLPNATAFGFYNDSISVSGWGILDIKAGHGVLEEDNAAAFAAGYLEGAFTAKQIWQNYQNLAIFFFKDRSTKVVNDVKNFLIAQDSWAREQVSKLHETDDFWRHVGYVLKQLDGLHAGYVDAAPKEALRDKFVVMMLNSAGDLLDLLIALDPEGSPDLNHLPNHLFRQFIHTSGHCSALIKITPGFEDLYLSHSSWFTYSATMRVYKHYNFEFGDSSTEVKSLSFSSYAGYLESLDDFYLLGHKMVLLQTTNNIFNKTLYKLVQHKSLLAWQRVRVANYLARNGGHWYQLLSRHNSGTYNNQYMVVDLRLVQLGTAIHDGALWVVEQIPGLVVGADQSAILRAGYWPSYNVPFYEEIFNRSGYPDIVKKRGLANSYQLAPRAKIFRRDQSQVSDLQAMKDIMRYNNFKNDPYSDGSPWNTICSRGDLASESPVPDGCYDTKVSDYGMALKMEAAIINGPTQSHGLSPFSWSNFSQVPHLGLPDKYDFDWIITRPQL